MILSLLEIVDDIESSGLIIMLPGRIVHQLCMGGQRETKILTMSLRFFALPLYYLSERFKAHLESF